MSNNSISGVLDGLWDTATGVFDKWIDFESSKITNQLALEQYRETRKIDQELAPQGGSSQSLGIGGSGQNIPWATIGIGAVGIFAAYKILNK